MAENKESDLRKIEEIIEIMKVNDLVEVEIKHGDHKILVKRSQPQQPIIAAVPMVSPNNSHAKVGADFPQAQVPEQAAAESSGTDEQLVEIKSPMVGTYYSSASPDSESYVETGSHVDPQKVICIVEAMKVMNEIKAETSGTITEILVTSGQAVEYGQVLFRVRPD